MTLKFDFTRQSTEGSLYDKGVYPPEFNDEFKQYIRKRDKYKCALCSKKSQSLDVHHINYTKYTVKVNCISLCRACHSKVHEAQWFHHAARNEWARKLYALVLAREKIKTVGQLRLAWSQSNAHNT